MIKLFLPLLAIAITAGIFQGAGAQTPTSGSIIGSETVIFSIGDALDNGSSFEARISSNSSFIVPTVLVRAGNGSSPIVDINEWRIYDMSGEPFVLADVDGPLEAQEGQLKSIAGLDMLPLGVPQGGSLGIVFDALGMTRGNQVQVTFIYITNAGSSITAKIAPTTQQLPFAVEDFELQTSSPSLTADDSFVDPEIHCEICTIVQYLPGANNASAAYVAGGIDLTGAQELVFWARGDGGNETATFKAAGKAGDNGNVTWANTTSVELGQDWQRYEIGLAGANLASVTHLFGFEVRGDNPQTFYLKGITYN